MQLIDKVERTIAINGAELRHIPLYGLKAVTIHTEAKTAVYADTDDFKTTSELASAEAHECGHVATASYYHPGDDELTVLRQEYKADKYAAHRFLPVRKIKKAIANGYTELWQMAELFGFDERFIRRTIDIYKSEEKL